jgi:hypothetical protein
MASRETRYRITCAAASPPNFRVGDGVLDNVCSMAILLHRRVPCIGPGRMPLRTHVETPMRHIAAAAGRVRTIGQLSFAGVGNFIHVLHIWSPVIGPGSRGRSRAHAAAPRLRPKEATIRFGLRCAPQAALSPRNPSSSFACDAPPPSQAAFPHFCDRRHIRAYKRTATHAKASLFSEPIITLAAAAACLA